ncbi:hypothetical protein MFIFM68171_06759 [Madurella fahalii]|uniref:Uncharacterized protein n=1 Tax=Madurella fahalii TaxID=1157608 RepID=A0ABQ0GFP0_9PEZI
MIPHVAVLFALLASSATAVPQPLAQEPSPPPLRSWEITRLTIAEGHYPGEARCRDLPVNTIMFDVRDPNRYSESSSSGGSTAKCTTSFPSCSPPYGTFFSCTTNGVGNWTFSFAPADTNAETSRWNLWQKSVVVLRLALPEQQQTLEAQARLSTDDNLQGYCNVLGTCALILKQGLASLLVTPTKVPTVGE